MQCKHLHLCCYLQESAKAALDEVTKSLMYLQDDMNSNYVSMSAHQEAVSRSNEQEERVCQSPICASFDFGIGGRNNIVAGWEITLLETLFVYKIYGLIYLMF